MMATFHTMRTTNPYPAIRWMMMKTASSREPETSPQNPLMNSTVTKTRISMFTQGCFTFLVTRSARPTDRDAAMFALVEPDGFLAHVSGVRGDVPSRDLTTMSLSHAGAF